MKRKIQLNLTCVLLILLVVVLGCSDGGSSDAGAKTPEKKIPAAYVGMWTAADGSTLTIRNDGSGDYKSGGSSMNGGSVEVDETAKEIRFSLLLFDSKYKIDEPPKDNKMKLDGMDYRRTGGFSTDDAKSESVKTPDEEEIRPAATETMRDFNRAISKGSFDDFYANISETWRDQSSVVEFNKIFAPIIKAKDIYQMKPDAPLDFSASPILKETGVLEVNIKYRTLKNEEVPVRLRYVKENGEWKLLGIRLNPE